MLLDLLKAVVLGTVQGITEFLPVSSTAHLIITEKLFKLDQNVYGLSFDMFINLGTLIAVIAFFWSDLKDIFGRMRLPSSKKPLSKQEKLPWLIILATIPVGLVGLALEKKIESDFRSLEVIVFSLIIVGILMILVERFSKPSTKAGEPTSLQIVLTSLSQCIALIPGVSRSGITISTAMALGVDRVTAARYSFMLSIPITLAATLSRLVKFGSAVVQGTVAGDVILFYCVGGLTSLIVSFLTLRFLMVYYKKHSLTSFAIYRFVLAAVLILVINRTAL